MGRDCEDSRHNPDTTLRYRAAVSRLAHFSQFFKNLLTCGALYRQGSISKGLARPNEAAFRAEMVASASYIRIAHLMKTMRSKR